ncbi:DUF3784 domain-containing protein [Foetidibacter luteolus]|uniref:DUF3784 domain-containing protein n=1 Tax=Foetidibacter luteolus TaxID=2608880 RepID=UPI00129A6D5C|nr:DUF3784 domain-containing protein [Foetidibacter luteolus]
MLRYVFAFILFLHGFIHLAGFTTAFSYHQLLRVTASISRAAGVGWLLAAVLFFAAGTLWLFKKDSWLIPVLVAVVASQALIIISWKDATAGTLVNILILLVAIPAFAQQRFTAKIRQEVSAMRLQAHETDTVITVEMLAHLPAVVQKWLRHSGVVGKQLTSTVWLRQVGEMRTKPGSRWMPFEATQYFTVQQPQFNWQVKARMMPLLTLTGRDRFCDGKGEMDIKLWSLINVASATGDDKTNTATMLRYLAEITWFPTAALSNYISWQVIDDTAARAVMTYKGITVSGIMKFKPSGDIKSFEAWRYMGSGKDAKPEKWLVEMTDYKVFNGMRIPHKNKVTWKLKTGDFNWANIEVTELVFNK